MGAARRDRQQGETDWEALRESLLAGLDGLRVERTFGELRSVCTALTASPSVVGLVALLHDVGADLDRKEGIYQELVGAAREHGPRARLAMRLVWIGLWPGLDRVRGRLQLRCPRRADLDAELMQAFVEAVARVDLGRSRRLAATLVRNTERRVCERVQREARRAVEHYPEPCELSVSQPEISTFGLPAGRPEAERIAVLRAWLVEIAGDDAELVVRAVLLGELPSAVGAELGLEEGVARKRVQRALQRVRAELERGVVRAPIRRPPVIG